MALKDDIGGDWAFFDGVANMTLEPLGGASIPNIKGLRRVLDRKTQTAFANLEPYPDDVTIHLWAATIAGGVEPKVEDVIVDAAGSWTILGLRLETLDTRWRCVCRKKKS